MILKLIAYINKEFNDFLRRAKIELNNRHES
jgi:hypothetical protein